MELQLSNAGIGVLLKIIKSIDPGEWDRKTHYLLEQIVNRVEDHSTILFPGPIDELNYEIMYFLGDEELFRACRLNMKTAELCRNEQFWRNRIIKIFGVYLADYIPQDTTYKHLYRALLNPKNNKLYVAIENGLTPLVKMWYHHAKEIKEQWKAYLKKHGIKDYRNIYDFIPSAIYLGHVDTINYILQQHREEKKYYILHKINYRKIAQAGDLEMFNLLLDQWLSISATHMVSLARSDFWDLHGDNKDLLRIILDKAYVHKIIDTKVIYDVAINNHDYDYIKEKMADPDIAEDFFVIWVLGKKDIQELNNIMLSYATEDDILQYSRNYRLLELWYDYQVEHHPMWMFSTDFFYSPVKNKFPEKSLQFIYDHSEQSADMKEELNKHIKSKHSRYDGISTRWLRNLAKKKEIDSTGTRTVLINRLLDANIDIEAEKV